jgi:hypothetical protein
MLEREKISIYTVTCLCLHKETLEKYEKKLGMYLTTYLNLLITFKTLTLWSRDSYSFLAQLAAVGKQTRYF